MTKEYVHLSDGELISEVKKAAATERDATVRVVALLTEVEARRLHLGAGYNSLFMFCTRALHMSEHAAYARIEAARAAGRFPTILDRLADGRLSLTTVGLLVPHLTEENGEELLDAAGHQSKRDVERLIAALHPQPDISATVRALPARPLSLASVESASSTSAPSLAAPLVAALPHPQLDHVALGGEPAHGVVRFICEFHFTPKMDERRGEIAGLQGGLSQRPAGANIRARSGWLRRCLTDLDAR